MVVLKSKFSQFFDTCGSDPCRVTGQSKDELDQRHVHLRELGMPKVEHEAIELLSRDTQRAQNPESECCGVDICMGNSNRKEEEFLLDAGQCPFTEQESVQYPKFGIDQPRDGCHRPDMFRDETKTLPARLAYEVCSSREGSVYLRGSQDAARRVFARIE